MTNEDNYLGKMVKRRRLILEMTLRQLSANSGVSSSHLSRIERGECLPSGRIIHKIAKPLGFGENELFTLVNYLLS